jgi:hypothetical protein
LEVTGNYVIFAARILKVITIMARPIRETPVLSGKDLENFLWNMEHPIHASQDEIDESRKIYEAVMSDPKSNWMR